MYTLTFYVYATILSGIALSERYQQGFILTPGDRRGRHVTAGRRGGRKPRTWTYLGYTYKKS